jgi:hypothetical protein
MKKEFKEFEIKSLDFNEETSEMFIEGYASVFEVKDAIQPMLTPDKKIIMVSDIVQRGAFSKTIQERGSRLPFCKNHNMDDPKGKIIELKEDDYGLYCKVRISDSEDELKTKIKEGIFSEFSFAFLPLKSEIKKEIDDTYTRRISEMKLGEISIVTIARNELAKITAVKSLSDVEVMFDDIIETEQDEKKKLNLMQIKSLVMIEPEIPLDTEKPIEVKKYDFSKYKFINNTK